MTDSLGRVNSDALASRFISEKPLDVEAWLGAQRLFILGAKAERTLEDLYYEFAWLGWVASRSQVLTAQAASKSAITPFMDWQGWVPGNPEAARRLLGDRDVPGLQDLLDRAGVTIRGIRDTRLKDLARILSNAQAAGTGYKQTAKAIREQFTRSRKWSEMVARTEGRRAVTAASKDYYAASGLEQVKWSTAWGNACPICKAFEDLGPVPLEGGFGGLDGPPGHPNCLCVIMPAAGVKAPGPVKAFDRVGREIPMPTAYTRNLIGDVPEPEEEPGLNLSVTGTLLKAGRNVIGEALAALDKIPDYDAENIRVPWPVTTRPKLDPELWAESVIESVDIKELHASQKLLIRARVRFYIENPGAIEEGRRAFANVYDRGSELVIVDGHHRLAALWLLGAEMANVWFMEGNA